VLLRAGTVIPAALITRLNSDEPGLVVAQVTAPVRDSLTGTQVVIPQGSRLIGSHAGRVASGQRRLPVRWTHLQTPDGHTRTPGSGFATDPSGAAGLTDQVDRHWAGVALAASVATLLNFGTELASDQDTALERALATATQDTVGRTAEALIQREIDRAPTLIIRPGTRVALLLAEDWR
jgi:type IV secretion system protein VirB10